VPDAPDYYRFRLDSERNVLGDMAELAVRLKSPVTYDRMGDVVWMEDFSTGVGRWRTVVGAGGSYVKVDASFSYWSGFNAKLYAGAAVGNGAAMYKYLSPPRTNRWGIEVSVAFASAFKWLRIELTHADAVATYRPQLQVNYVTQKLEYLGDDSAYHVLGSLSEMASAYGLYHHLKMVVDFETLEYVKVRQDGNLYDMAGIPILPTADAEVPSSIAFIGLYSDNTNAATARLGSVIVTANEP
jgi:hypothetical protein